jgi:hypothetical protein
MAAEWRVSASSADVQLTGQKHRSASIGRDDFTASISSPRASETGLERIVPRASTFNTRTRSKSGGNDDEETRQGSRGCSLQSQPWSERSQARGACKEEFSHMDRTGAGQKSLRAIARELATRGFLNERGKPYAASLLPAC